MAVNVSTLMWLNTVTNNQYVHGTKAGDTFKALYRQGGLARFYNGFATTLIHGCVARFGDIYAHSIVKENSNNCSIVNTLQSATLASGIRGLITPIETLKVMRQVDNSRDCKITRLYRKARQHGPSTLWNGSGAVFTSNFVGYVPWFYTYDVLNNLVRKFEDPCHQIIRNGSIGFVASVVSDVVSNSVRVLKTLKQTDALNRSYITIVKNALHEKDSTCILFRGLSTRICTNGVQSVLFTVLWNLFDKN